jgi:hypothetical protein
MWDSIQAKTICTVFTVLFLLTQPTKDRKKCGTTKIISLK